MPTGYTAPVADGTITSLRAYALKCARAFGATITMRDDPPDAEIPDLFEPSSFYVERLAKARARRRHLQALSPIEAQREMQQQHSAAMANWREQTIDDARQRVRYSSMLHAVETWQPPTPEHDGLRKFMIKQLTDSIAFDCGGTHLPMPRLKRWPEWLASEIAKTQRDIDYFIEHSADAWARAITCTQWVRALRDSLPAEAHQQQHKPAL